MAARPHRSAAHVEKFGSGLSHIPWVAQVSAPSHMQSPRGDRTAKTIRKQTVKEPITSYIGRDIHKESIAIAEADRAALAISEVDAQVDAIRAGRLIGDGNRQCGIEVV